MNMATNIEEDYRSFKGRYSPESLQGYKHIWEVCFREIQCIYSREANLWSDEEHEVENFQHASEGMLQGW